MSNLLTPAEVCERLAISRKTLQRLTDKRFIGFVKVGGQVRFRPEAVDVFLLRGEVIPRPVR